VIYMELSVESGGNRQLGQSLGMDCGSVRGLRFLMKIPMEEKK
jgi:hypothetical protein